MVGTIICEVIIIMCDIVTINVRFYLLEVSYSRILHVVKRVKYGILFLFFLIKEHTGEMGHTKPAISLRHYTPNNSNKLTKLTKGFYLNLYVFQQIILGFKFYFSQLSSYQNNLK
jgi:hypothetical protein